MKRQKRLKPFDARSFRLSKATYSALSWARRSGRVQLRPLLLALSTLLASCTHTTSLPIRVDTPDSTSHDFTWAIDTLSNDVGRLFDAAIVNDTLAYVVGEMFHRDSLWNPEPTFYNLAVWNGER
jgi:hypothetical protein